MRGERPRNICTGCQHQVGAGGSIGRGRITVHDFSGLRRGRLFVLYAPERQVYSWLSHARFLGNFMLEVLLRVARHN